MSSNFIKDFWDNQAKVFKADHTASWWDNFAIDLEIANISKYIFEWSKVLDVWCANGYSAFRQLERKPKEIIGVDFSEPMIEFALKQKKFLGVENIAFSVWDVLNLNFPDNTFDVTYTTRVIINLPNWQDQLTGIEECIRVTKPGGKIILSEAFYEPLVLLNALRALKSLSPLVEHDFNRYIKKGKLEKFLDDNALPYEVEDFSSIYYLGSRFLRDLVTNPEDYPGYSNPINKIFYEIEQQFSGGWFGIQMAYVIQKP